MGMMTAQHMRSSCGDDQSNVIERIESGTVRALSATHAWTEAVQTGVSVLMSIFTKHHDLFQTVSRR